MLQTFFEDSCKYPHFEPIKVNVCLLFVGLLVDWLVDLLVCLLVCWLVGWFVGLLVCWFACLFVFFWACKPTKLFFSGILSGNAWDYVEVLQINQRIFFLACNKGAP